MMQCSTVNQEASNCLGNLSLVSHTASVPHAHVGGWLQKHPDNMVRPTRTWEVGNE